MSWGTGLVVHVGGLMVIVSIAMIFLFLLATVVQLLRPAKLEQFAAYPAPGGGASHEALTRAAAEQRPGESGLLALDWNNGNRTILIDPQLSGLILGQSLQTQPGEIYRALIEATAFGARVIMERIEESGVPINEVIACGGIAEKNSLLMRIYADITERTMKISRSSQTCALGAAICGAVAGGVYPDVPTAQEKMTGAKNQVYKPDEQTRSVYNELYGLYRRLHDAFGVPHKQSDLFPIMKDLLKIRRQVGRSG